MAQRRGSRGRLLGQHLFRDRRRDIRRQQHRRRRLWRQLHQVQCRQRAGLFHTARQRDHRLQQSGPWGRWRGVATRSTGRPSSFADLCRQEWHDLPGRPGQYGSFQRLRQHECSNVDQYLSIWHPLPGNYSSPVYFNGSVYFGPVADTVQAFRLSNGLLSTAATSRTSASYAYPGGALAISANGTSNGILWAVEKRARRRVCCTHTMQATLRPSCITAPRRPDRAMRSTPRQSSVSHS